MCGANEFETAFGAAESVSKPDPECTLESELLVVVIVYRAKPDVLLPVAG